MNTLQLHRRDILSGTSPEQAFRSLATDENPFWLDSGLHMPRVGRYGMMGSDPFLVYKYRDGKGIFRESNGRRRVEHGNPFQQLRSLVQRYQVANHPLIPFAGGVVSLNYGGILPRSDRSRYAAVYR